MKTCTCYFFDDIIKIKDFDFNNVLFDEKSYENILVYDILYETLIGAKPLLIRYNEIDEFVKVCDGNR